MTPTKAQDAFFNKKWGIFYHFLGGACSAKDWNERVNNANAAQIAKEAHDIGAGFLGITLMQCYRTMLAPNKTFDDITGYKPGEACAKRDFILDLSDELQKYGIGLMLYFTGDGPNRESPADEAFGFSVRLGENYKIIKQEPEIIPESFVDKWSSVLREYSLRYGKRVFAWWIDGCYDSVYGENREKMLAKYKKAILDGNPDALVAFNGGVKEHIFRHSQYDDYTAGEVTELEEIPCGRLTDGAQSFIFPTDFFWYCKGGFWNDKKGHEEMKMRYTKDEVLAYARKVRENGGVIMFDTNFDNDSTIKPDQKEALSRMNELV